ncbi:MAG: aldolase/citrate lyase family protein [Lachnospiraceae bacterium]|nr:aldolase/citrate lyase family protein [Lachnospiraceae bacterium]MDD7378661.1 aldolase/citrate lyase family protein [Lachnospiraceae bacterium]MDY4617722.1 aldolase/citrate lyase family protein [Lachnospiraceae bacterium]
MIKEKLQQGENVLGTWCLLPSADVINVIAKTGLDFVLLDMEHGAMSYETILKMNYAAEAEGVSTIVRVGDRNEVEILKALDTGCKGIIVPHIETKEQCEEAMSYIQFPPEGIRGFSPYTRSGAYHNYEGYTKEQNRKLLTGIIIEGEEGISNIEEVINHPALDVVYVGTYDISSMLGIAGQVNHPKVLDILKECVEKIHKQGKIPGCMFSSLEEVRLFKEIGMQFMVYSVDSAVIYDGYKKVLEDWRKFV